MKALKKIFKSWAVFTPLKQHSPTFPGLQHEAGGKERRGDGFAQMAGAWPIRSQATWPAGQHLRMGGCWHLQPHTHEWWALLLAAPLAWAVTTGAHSPTWASGTASIGTCCLPEWGCEHRCLPHAQTNVPAHVTQLQIGPGLIVGCGPTDWGPLL